MNERTTKAIEVLERMRTDLTLCPMLDQCPGASHKHVQQADAIAHVLTLIRETAKEATHAAQSDWVDS